MVAFATEPGKMAGMVDTDETRDDALDPIEGVDAPPSTGAVPVDIGGWPTWARRLAIAATLLIAVGVLAWGASRGQTGGGDAGRLDAAIVALFPVDGAQALRQTEIGADLAPGYDGRLIINGIEIPEAQMEGARDPSTISAEDLAENGLRPNNRNRVYFRPGPGKVIEEYTTGPVDVVLRFFEEGQPGSTTRSVSWQIRVD